MCVSQVLGVRVSRPGSEASGACSAVVKSVAWRLHADRALWARALVASRSSLPWPGAWAAQVPSPAETLGGSLAPGPVPHTGCAERMH